ncbi:MAG: ABC transporter permease [Bacteroidia bacterium]|nr:ABC transporter permease [Bacteroidia bacterium]
MRTILFLLQKEFRQIFRNPSILRVILIMPVVQLLIIPLAADYEIKNINLSVVDHDHSSYSQKLTAKILSSGYFRLNDFSPSFNKSFSEFQKDNSDLILEIPSGFEKDLVRENKAGLFIAVNAINGMKAVAGSAYLSGIISDFNAEILMEWTPPVHPASVAGIQVVPSLWFNPGQTYRFFMVPGVLVILVTMVGAYLCALNIVKEKETGTIEQINVTPVKKHHFILGKLIPFWVIGVFSFSLGLFVIARFVYGIVPAGSLLLLYLFLSVYLVAVLGFGLLVSTYSATQQQAMSLSFFSMTVFILMSGLFTPVESMPVWAQWIARCNPVTYFMEVIRMIVLKGSTFPDIRHHFLIVILFGTVFNVWAILHYRKTV